MKMHEYVVANLVPVAVPDICCLTILLNSKLLCCNTKRAILIRSSVLKELFSLLSKASFKAFNPASWRILGYRAIKSDVTETAPSGILYNSFIWFIKSPESLIYDLPFCIRGLRWWSKKSDSFSDGVPQLDITDLSGTFARRLCILGKR